MWAGQQVLHLLQDLFKQGRLSLMLALTWGKCKGSCSDWDSWVPCIALHARRNVAQCLKHLEILQAIEHSTVVNACKMSGNSYHWSQVTTVFIRKSTSILYGTSSKFYPSPHAWRHHASWSFPLSPSGRKIITVKPHLLYRQNYTTCRWDTC